MMLKGKTLSMALAGCDVMCSRDVRQIRFIPDGVKRDGGCERAAEGRRMYTGAEGIGSVVGKPRQRE